MKKYIFIAVACLSIAACTKEASGGKDDPDVPGTSFTKGQKVTLTVSAGDQTKVTSELNGTSIDFKWENNDKVKVIVNEGQTGEASATFTIKSISDDRKTASFEGVMPSGGTEFRIQYPVDDPTITTQTYSSIEAIPHGKMLLKSEDCSLGETIPLSAQNAVLRLNLYGTGMTIGKIVTYLYDDPNSPQIGSYTLNCSNKKISDSEKTPTALYIVLPCGAYRYTTINVYDNTEAIINSYTISKLSLNQKIIGTEPKNLIKEPLFSVNAVKKVKFTKGNLYWNGSGFQIEERQFECPSTREPNYIGHFFWTNLNDYNSGNADYMPYASNYSYSSRSTSDKFFCGEDNKLTVDDQSGLYALTKDEWVYLISNRTNASSLCKYGVTVVIDDEKKYTNCLIIAPDGYTGTICDSYTEEEWLEAEETGLVCLPAAGTYSESSISVRGEYGCYWSSMPRKIGAAYILNFGNSGLYPEGTEYFSRGYGLSIRLVY